MRHNTALVDLEVVIAFEFRNDGTVHKHFLLNEFFTWHIVVSSNIVGALQSGKCRTTSVILTLIALSPGLIRGALLGRKVCFLVEVAVEDGPAAVAALVEIVAHHRELRGQTGNLNVFVRIFQL